MMSVRIGINGFGRIGRNVFRVCQHRKAELEIVAVNDLTSPATLAHLLKYDSVHGKINAAVYADEVNLMVNDQKIKVFNYKNPADIPWGEPGVDIVIEATGRFVDRENASLHLKSGVKKVIISAPGKKVDATIVMGVNQNIYEHEKHDVISNASCTTNCLAPIVKVLYQNFGIEYGMMTTVHSYTNDQQILDLPHKDLRRARAAALSIIPTTTGAAKAVGKVLPELAGKLNGFAIRVPTPNVSMVDFVAQIEKATEAPEVNAALLNAAEGELKGILGFSDEPLVSRDYYGDSRSSIVDGLSTMVMGGKLVKVMAWYDNEWGYSCRVVDLAEYLADFF
ncbi:glyceraldehyde 3-phosphate dehydrogenase [Desulfotomaculum arcticum]|uniref:Glyceraldehyde-3-phosphate dehydrogenase n=2 Tax=Desulfotruncus TaxID=2867377 RepID=A0A1I2QKC3_9FIRM|nr:glyceraldehyde 3-phosphate dehydrogenase [Desulfotomaculum arcticum] [Desulfotruncus arcticus DSM 17038]